MTTLTEKWAPVLDAANTGLPAIKNDTRRHIMSTILENTVEDLKSSQRKGQLHSLTEDIGALNEDGTPPTNNMSDGHIDYVDPVLIAMLRRVMPNLMVYDIAGVQPMRGPTGLIFALKARYDNQSGTEALFNEANSAFTAVPKGANTANYPGQVGSTPVGANATNYTAGTGMQLAVAEALGSSANNEFPEMAFSIDKLTVTAKTRALKAEYSVELAQDLKALHGLDAESELVRIMTTEILAEINREVIRKIIYTSTVGAQEGTTTAGFFDLDTDSNGRWLGEKFKGLMFQIEREANAVAVATRRGKANFLICSYDVASALSMAGKLDFDLTSRNDLGVDPSRSTYAGTLNGYMKVYIDPYHVAQNGVHYFTVGYKGDNETEAGIFYCPYVPLQMFRAQDPDTFQPKIAYKTRYGLVANPFSVANNNVAGNGSIAFADKNTFFRTVAVKNIM